MSERKCALESKTYMTLKEIYENREKTVLDWKKQGKKAVWTFGCDVPDEVIVAAGMLPVRIAGKYGQQPNADKYLENSFGPVWRAMFEKAVCDENPGLYDYIAISKSSDMLMRIFYYLREVKRFEPEKPLPPLYFVDLDLISRNMDSHIWNESIVKLFIKAVETWCMEKLSDSKLIKASAICNANRDALAAFSQLRLGETCKVNGTEALTVIGATLFMEKEKSTALVKQLTEEALNWPVVDSPKIFFTGSVQESTEVYDLIEKKGGVVCAEDHDWGNRHFDGNVDLSFEPLKGITARYINKLPSSEQSYVAVRVESLVKNIRQSGAEAVIVYMNFNDESYLLDYPSLKKQLDELKIPSITVSGQKVPIEEKDNVGEKFAAFIKSIRN